MKEWCDAGGQYLGYGTERRPGDIVTCELCGRCVRLTARFGRYDVTCYPRHKQLPKKEKR
jgi:hypothetical protein